MKNPNYLLLLGSILIQVNQSELIGQSNGSPPAGGGQAQATATFPTMPNGGGANSGGVPAGAPEPSTGLDGVSWDGKSFKITDARIIDSKFSAYLNESEISYNDEMAYAKLVNELSERLDVFRIRTDGKKLLDEVLPILKTASKHPSDGGLCRQIYNAVGVDVQSKDANFMKLERIKEIKKEIETLKWNMSVTAKPNALDPKPNYNNI